jgi:hypothetical protein
MLEGSVQVGICHLSATMESWNSDMERLNVMSTYYLEVHGLL